jgi:hypothetical protein
MLNPNALRQRKPRRLSPRQSKPSLWKWLSNPLRRLRSKRRRYAKRAEPGNGLSRPASIVVAADLSPRSRAPPLRHDTDTAAIGQK